MQLKYLVIQTKPLAQKKRGREGLKSLNPSLPHPGVRVKYLAPSCLITFAAQRKPIVSEVGWGGEKLSSLVANV